MESTISVEQYFMYEIVATINTVVAWVNGENRNVNQWNKQLHKLKKAFHYFMMEMEVDELKDLKLPSEKKPKSKTKKRIEKGKKSVGVKFKKAKEGGKQLQLFFVKKMKKGLLVCLEGLEGFYARCSTKLFGKVEDFENRIKS